jgi:hypothetical protein
MTSVGIPEADYPKLATVDGCVEYLAARIGREKAGVIPAATAAARGGRAAHSSSPVDRA